LGKNDTFVNSLSFFNPRKAGWLLAWQHIIKCCKLYGAKAFRGQEGGLTASLFYNPNSPHPLYSKNCGLPFLTDRSGKIIFKVPPNYLKLAKSTHKSTFQ
jgi:hypothetical protein